MEERRTPSSARHQPRNGGERTQEPRRYSRVVGIARQPILTPPWQGRPPTTEAERRKARLAAQQRNAAAAEKRDTDLVAQQPSPSSSEKREATTYVDQHLSTGGTFLVRFTDHPYIGPVDEELLQRYIDEPEDGVRVEEYRGGRIVRVYER